jgi:hypothetical protein
MLRCLVAGLGNDRYAEPAADHLGDSLERHALLGDRMIGAVDGAALKREPEDAGSIEAMHGGPAVEAVAHIGRHVCR